jgi:hypothetical protein
MPSARLQRAPGNGPAGAVDDPLAARSAESRATPLVLGAALLLVCLYAAFAHGAVSSSAEERLQLAVAAIAVVAIAAWQWQWQWPGTLHVQAPVIVWVALGLLGAFALWSGVTVLWSVSPDQTWTECNRAVTYLIVLGLAIAVGASHPRSVPLIASGFLLVCLVVSADALGQKLVPGLHIPGIVSLDQTGTLPRLQEPLGYWNALALLIAMGVPAALVVAVDRRHRAGVRLGAAAGMSAMLLAIGLTYSRGGVLALAAALIVVIAGGGDRLRSLMWLAMAVAAAAPVLLVGLDGHQLTAAGVGLPARELAGAELSAVLVACLMLLVLAGRRVLELEPRTTLSPSGARRIRRVLIVGTGAVAAAAVLAVALSARGLDGTVSHAWSSFTATRATSVSDPGRLLSADSENRWVWWKEAAGAFADRPLGGWGAGSFGVVHLLYRRDALSVQQPHSVPLQFLAETGIVGAALGLGAFALLLVAGRRAVRRRGAAPGRLAATALLAGAVAYAVHELYDWDWDIPAVTIPALLFLGTLGGSLAAGRRPAADGRVGSRARRALGLGLGTVGMVAFAVSVAVPRIAAGDAARALVTASSAGSGSLHQALADAQLASRLDPLSDAGLRAASTIAIRRRDLRRTRADLLAAVRRQPTDGSAWQELTFADLQLRDDAEAVIASRRELALDPRGPATLTFAQRAMVDLAPPSGSATASPTPGDGSP